MKRLSSITALFLCLVLLCSTLAACGGKDDGKGAATTESPVAETEKVIQTDENGYEMDELPSSYDWNDADFNILSWKEMRTWEWCEELSENSTAVDEALYNRMQEIETRFNLTLHMTYEDGNWSNRATFIQKLEVAETAGTPFDLVSQYSHAAGEAAVKQLYVDLNRVDYVNFEKPWWPEKINETATIGQKLYFATGDITPTLIRNVHCMYINLSIFDAYEISKLYDNRTIYEIVKDGDWTLETMEEMALDKVDTANGVYGITFTNPVALDAFYFGAGFRMVNNENGVLELSSDLVSSRMIDYYDKLASIYHNDNVKNEETDKLTLFSANKSFVHSATVADAQRYTEKAVEFALLPMPKLDTAQTEYYTVANYWVSMFAIPVHATNQSMSGMVLEALASVGYRAIKDIVYFNLFQARFMAVKEKAEMLDLVTASVVFDSGRTFSTGIGSLWADFRNGINGGEAWTTIYGSKASVWAENVTKLFATLG